MKEITEAKANNLEGGNAPHTLNECLLVGAPAPGKSQSHSPNQPRLP
jgi:hypothetical protein